MWLIVLSQSSGLNIRLDLCDLRVLSAMKATCEIKRLAEAEELAYLTNVCSVNDGYVVKVALLLLGLLRQDVAVISVMSLDLTCARQRKTLLGAGVGLYFWHFL